MGCLLACQDRYPTKIDALDVVYGPSLCRRPISIDHQKSLQKSIPKFDPIFDAKMDPEIDPKSIRNRCHNRYIILILSPPRFSDVYRQTAHAKTYVSHRSGAQNHDLTDPTSQSIFNSFWADFRSSTAPENHTFL